MFNALPTAKSPVLAVAAHHVFLSRTITSCILDPTKIFEIDLSK